MDETMADKPSESGITDHVPSKPKNVGTIKSAGMKNINWRVRLRKIANLAFPMD